MGFYVFMRFGCENTFYGIESDPMYVWSGMVRGVEWAMLNHSLLRNIRGYSSKI